MVTAEDVRQVARRLPRSETRLVGGRVKFYVGRIVYAALSEGEGMMGFSFPREEREALIASDPDKFLPPKPADARYQWIRVRLDRLDRDELWEIVVDAWSMVVPKRVSEEYLAGARPERPVPRGENTAPRLRNRSGGRE